ncbi:MAG: CDP-alcohol phosphatidyltransferase family protein [Pseudomonadota bacterium]
MPEPKTRRLAARWIGRTPVRVWGVPVTERLRRSLVHAGVWDSADWTGAPPPAVTGVMLFLGDHVYDDALVRALARAPGTVVADAAGRPACAHVAAEDAATMAQVLASGRPVPSARAAGDLVPAHSAKLRRRADPFVLAVTETSRRAVEDRLFDASYKGVTDAVTKYLWPAPARAVCRACVRAGVTPNAVTLASLVLAVAAFLLFRDGALAGGLACAWAMTFLDTVDGKLARVTLTASRLGDVLDHGLDLIHPPFWWWAWWVGAGAVDGDAILVVVIGYVVLRVQEGLFLKRFGMELHVWRPFDSRFRLITARRNPILVVLTVALALGAPEQGMRLVAAWTLVSLAVHAVRILMALRLQQQEGDLLSWLE